MSVLLPSLNGSTHTYLKLLQRRWWASRIGVEETPTVATITLAPPTWIEVMEAISSMVAVITEEEGEEGETEVTAEAVEPMGGRTETKESNVRINHKVLPWTTIKGKTGRTKVTSPWVYERLVLYLGCFSYYVDPIFDPIIFIWLPHEAVATWCDRYSYKAWQMLTQSLLDPVFVRYTF